MKTLTEEEVLARLVAWAKENSSVRAMIMTSSRVNPMPVVDKFSDFDVEVYVDSLRVYQRDDEWMNTFGSVLVRCPWLPASYKPGWLTRMAVYKEGFRIDFQITNLDLVKENYVDGYRVLLDKDGMTNDLPAPTYEGYRVQKPTLDEWQKFTHEFWWDVIYVAKSLARDELFYAKFMSEATLRFDYFQKLIEWSICIEHGWNTQPNKFGRFFKRYVPPERWKRIEGTFAGANIEENWEVFLNSLELFRELANEVGTALELPYPSDLDDEVSEYIDEIRRAAL